MELSIYTAACEAAYKGANIVLEWRRPVETFKGTTEKVEKHVRMVGRIGIDYNKIADVRAKRANGELPAEAQPIWKGAGEFEIFPYLIRHKGTGQRYARLYFGTSETVKPKTAWFIDGREVSYEVVLPLLTAKERRDERDGDTFCVKIENLIRVGSEVDYSTIDADEPAIEATTSAPAPVTAPAVPA